MFNCRLRDSPLKKTTQFRQILDSGELEFLLEAHNGITAKTGEEADSKRLWTGGICMSAQYGVRDSNKASWTQVLTALARQEQSSVRIVYTTGHWLNVDGLDDVLAAGSFA